MIKTKARPFNSEETQTWREIITLHTKKRDHQVCDIFLKGLSELGITAERIPNLEEINKIIRQKSGFEGVYVSGLEDGQSFYKMLSEKKFPVGNFIRDRKDLGYTPEPDIVHDLYGHLPFFVDKEYGDFCYNFGVEACKYLNHPDFLRQFERFFWFTIEFGLIQTKDGLRVFGAGIASSTGECDYALSGKPKIIPFSVDAIRAQEFRIDVMQDHLFCLNSAEQLYGSLAELSENVKREYENNF
ncbi:MAG: hypothetical protein IPM97_05260 [Bdellovibrionaceae bacterium]|nr:hypothetical protein [Pseudobdellovibrionaceae bacterium]